MTDTPATNLYTALLAAQRAMGEQTHGTAFLASGLGK